jgi:uncharacterized protein (TIGR02246 family)
MRSAITSVAVSVVLLTLLVMPAPARGAAAEDKAADEAAIRAKVDAFTAAWNKDDTRTMAAQWSEDGTLVNPFGDEAHGRAEIEKVFIAEHTAEGAPFKQSTYTVSDVKVQWVTPDAVIVDLKANIAGVKRPDGSAAPDFAHRVAWTLVKKDGGWSAAAAHAFKPARKPGAGGGAGGGG